MRLYRLIIVLSFLFVTLNVNSQINEDDINSLSIFSEYVKAKNYDAAYEPWMELRERNPRGSIMYIGNFMQAGSEVPGPSTWARGRG